MGLPRGLTVVLLIVLLNCNVTVQMRNISNGGGGGMGYWDVGKEGKNGGMWEKKGIFFLISGM